MSNHTPGPWVINQFPQSSADISIGAVGTPLIAKVALRDVSIVEQSANALLIAAAPEMLDALKIAVMQNSCDVLMTGKELRKCDAAIAKAMGVTT